METTIWDLGFREVIIHNTQKIKNVVLHVCTSIDDE